MGPSLPGQYFPLFQMPLMSSCVMPLPGMCQLKVGGTILATLGVPRNLLARMVTFGAASEAKVDMPIARFLLCFEMEDNTGSTVFVTMDSEVQKLVRHTAYVLIEGSYDSAI
ncbi:uncharacterized protein LOC113349952 isoform X2 [Papaver somniferum]|uniref:uncharacterized protein LOC113349952 isoform X2 n=1 Tax=Papaver somniferum TaxID=3469 RepID=UPI000E6FACFC|nr:uncharacterized protein LOC113349952 isoform X2 [Papaver somniferum]